MADEQVIFEIIVDDKEAAKRLEKNQKALGQVSQRVVELRKKQQELRKQIKETGDSTGEYTKELSENSERLKEAQREQRALAKETTNETKSLNQLRAQLINLKRERDSVNLATESGRKRFSELTKQIKEQNDAIKQAEQAGGDFRRNVGNYTEAAKEAVAQTGLLNNQYVEVGRSVITASKGLNIFKAALVSTGIGALLVALGSLVAFFNRSEKGARLLEQATAGLGAIFDELTELAIKVGEFLFNAFNDPQQAIEDLGQLIVDFVNKRIEETIRGVQGLGQAFIQLFEGDFTGALETASDAVLDLSTGLNPLAGIVRDNADEIGNFADQLRGAAGAAAELARAEQLLFDRTTDAIVPTARLRREIEELKLAGEDQSNTEQERISFLESAISATNRLFDIEASLARQRLANIRQEIENTPPSQRRVELLREEAEAQAEVEQINADRASRLKETNNQLQALLKTQRQLREEQDLQREQAQEQIEQTRETFEDFQKIPAETTEVILQSTEDQTQAQGQLLNQQVRDKKQAEEQKRQLAALTAEGEKELAFSVLDATKQVLGEQSVIGRAISTFEALRNTYVGITNALANIPAPANIPFAAAIGVQGFAQVAQINNLQPPGFAQGGVIRDGVPIRRANGDDRLITAKTGEVVLNKRQQAMLGGNKTFRRMGVPGFIDGGIVADGASSRQRADFDQTQNLASQLRSIPAPVVTVSDINKVTNRVNVVDNNSTL